MMPNIPFIFHSFHFSLRFKNSFYLFELSIMTDKRGCLFCKMTFLCFVNNQRRISYQQFTTSHSIKDRDQTSGPFFLDRLKASLV